MKNVNHNELINIEEETTALYEFTKSRWTGLDDDKVKTIIENSFNAGLNAGKYWVDELSFSDIYSDWLDERKKPENWNISSEKEKEIILKFISTYDDVYQIGYQLVSGSSAFKNIIQKNWDFSTQTEKLVKEIKKLVPDANNYKPKGYAKLRKGYSDHDGFEEYNDNQYGTDFDEFNGVNSNSAVAGGFTDRIALPSVMYDHVCQGRNALLTLTSAAFAHGLYVAAHNNSATILHELKALREEYFQPKYFTEPVYLGDLTNIVNSKIFKAILLTFSLDRPKDNEINSQADLTNHMQARVSERLNKKEPTAEEMAERKKMLADMMKNIFSQTESADELAKRKEKEKNTAEGILAFLNGSDNKLKM